MFRRASRPVFPVRRTLSRRPRFDLLESRELLALFTVTNNLDSGPGSLRDAITSVNANSAVGADSIEFQIANSGVQTISLLSPLPALTRSVVIDGSTEPGFSINNPSPVVVIDGTNAGQGANGLSFSSGTGSIVKALSIVGFAASGTTGGSGILVSSMTSNLTVQGSYLGVLPDGHTARPNFNGVVLTTSGNNVGIVGAANTNVISGNLNAGVLITGSGAGANRLVNNLIGTDATGFDRVGNHYGVVVASANNTIGGLATSERNVISGNIGPNGTDGIGILLQTNARGISVRGNLIGTDITGGTGSLTTTAVGNVYGVYFGTPGGSNTDNVSSNTIGGTVAGAGNVISGNFVGITGNVTSSLIAGNTIGLAGPGSSVAVPNSLGILLGASGTTIGGTTPEARNVISASNGSGGTSGVGLDLTGDANLIQGNYVGAFLNSAADLPANAALRNVTGISLHVTNTTIGGTAAGAGNIISGNLSDGLVLGTNVGNLVQGNSIGRTPDLLGNLPNGGSGIVLALAGPTTPPTAPLAINLTIGGTEPGAANTIASSGGANIVVRGSYPTGITGLAIRGNSIYGNTLPGIDLNNSGVPLPPSLFLTSAVVTAGNYTFEGVVRGLPSTTYAIDIFGSAANAPVNPDGFGPGQIYLGTVTVTTDGTGLATFNPSFPSSAVNLIAYSATMTGPDNSTSEFSTNFPIANSVPQADVAVSLTSSATSLPQGSQLTLTATIVNNGASPATDVQFFDTLPLSLVNVQVTTSLGTATLNGNVASALLGTLAPGATATVRIIGTVSQQGPLVDTAGASSATLDPDYSNNEATQTVTVTPPVINNNADLSIIKVASPSAGTIGSNLTYTVTVVNNGPATATNVTVNDFLPASATLISVMASQGGTPTVSGTLVTGNLGTIASGASATITIIVRPTVAATITNSANVSGNQYDPVPGNNSTSLSTIVTAPNVGLKLTSAVLPQVGTVGQIQLFIFTVTNTGTSPATNVTMINALPTNAIFVRAAPTQGAVPTPVNGIITANIGTLAPGATAKLIIVVVPTKPGPLFNYGGVYTPDVPSLPASFAYGAVLVQPVPIPAGPRVIGVAGSGKNSQLVITFSAPLDATTATRRSNFQLYETAPNGRNRRVTIVSATYDKNSNSVRIVPVEPLTKSKTYRLVVVGTAPTGITNVQGIRLVGTPGGAPGTNFTANFLARNLPQV
ncbi:hypothetical protein P12x_001507 [Tundrisphaera lichenicola]|uniref:hypothetical protein n=1 Tax=Tundrisphaera lichenicola TaxID=2029860 RepID=UPI003EBD8389